MAQDNGGFTARRALLLGGVAAVIGAGAFAARWYNIGAEITGDALSVQDAHAKAASGEVFLIDIRRPDEWARTGVGEGAHPLDMRRPDFGNALLAITGGDVNAPVALICATGVRSRYLSNALAEAGFTQVVNVPEGMMGSGAGPGWIRAGLPVVKS